MKKITKFLDSVMGGIKRTCVAKALAVFAVASVTTSSFAQTTETTKPVINGVEDFVGLTPDQVKAAVVAENYVSSPNKFDDKTKVLFLYNVKTGKFLNVGGYWGTCASLHDYGKALWVNAKKVNAKNEYLRFAVDNINDTGNWLGYMFAADNERDRDVYIDRGSDKDHISSSTWTIELKSGDNNIKNTVKIFTTINSAPANFSDQVGKTYYLSANPDYDGTNNSCDAYETPVQGYDEWRIFTYDQIYEAQKDGSVDNMKDALDLSFRLKSPTFDRHDGDIQYWKTFNFVNGDQNKAGFAKFGLEKYHTTSLSWNKAEAERKWEAGYNFNGMEFTDVQDYQCYLAKYFCGSITGKCGILYQDINITLPGTYVIECKGYSNTTKAKLFAGVLDLAHENNKMVDGTMNSTVFNQTSNMTADEQTRLHISEKNMDYAGQAFFDNRKYMNSVVLTVPESAFYKNGSKTDKYTSITIRLGVMTGVYNTDASQVEDAAPGEWTVFDDFRLQYASNKTGSDLILDQDRNELGYLVNSNELFQNKTLHLNKKFVLDKWNTFVLPVNLTKDQVWSAFGGTTRLAKLSNLTETGIEFESVDLTSLKDKEPAIEAYQPYIIFPGKGADQTPKYTGTVYVNNKSVDVTIAADHYVIPKVSLLLTKDGNKDFSKMDQSTWATNMSVKSTDGKMEAWGTFARTFDPNATQDEKEGTWNFSNNKGNIIGGRDDLRGCYFFDNGKMYHSSSDPDKYRVRGLRGFSCWFKPVNGTTTANALFTLDGVSQGTTGIEDILADYEQPVSRFANGIYNLNGQLVKQGNSTAGLPSGMYIVNGKKCIVR